MTRTERLFQLMQAMRSAAPPVKAEMLAQDLGVSPRTIYRDIDTLRGLGAVIDGEAGFGYTLIEDSALPPMAFEMKKSKPWFLACVKSAKLAIPPWPVLR